MPKITLAEQILDFWLLSSLFSQRDFEFKHTKDEMKNREKIYYHLKYEDKEMIFGKGKFPFQDWYLHAGKEKKKFFEICQKEKKPEQKYIVDPESGYFTFEVGAVSRNVCIETLKKLLSIESEEIEKDTTNIACFSLQLKNNGEYVSGSFCLSPVLWVIKKLSENFKIEMLKKETYLSDLKKFENRFFTEDKMITYANEIHKMNDAGYSENSVCAAIIEEIYAFIRKEYIRPFISEEQFLIDYRQISFTLYRSKNDYSPENEEKQNLSMDFYSDDLSLVKQFLEDDPDLVDYICATNAEDKFDFFKPKDIDKFKKKVLYLTNIKNMPLGKWPSKYSLSFMQQVAVNLATSKYLENEYRTIFSVNGPPGTGKTTLLKEVVVNNIVERARLLVKYKNPDDAFYGHAYTCGKKDGAYSDYWSKWYSLRNNEINSYSTIVASCNNNAVENISKDLPKSASLLKDLLPEEKDSRKEQLQELADLFQSKKSGKDEQGVYFSGSAEKLINKDCWGLLSVPLGRSANINAFYNKFLWAYFHEFMTKDNIPLHQKMYREQREVFLEQLDKVLEMQKLLQKNPDRYKELLDAEEKYKNKDEYTKQLDEKNRELKKYLDSICSFENDLKNEQETEKKLSVDLMFIQNELQEKIKEQESFKAELKSIDTERNQTLSSVGFFARLLKTKKYTAAIEKCKNLESDIDRIQEKIKALENNINKIENKKIQKSEYMEQLKFKQSGISKEILQNRRKKNLLNAEIQELKNEVKEAEKYPEFKKQYDNFIKKIDVNVLSNQFFENYKSGNAEQSKKAQLTNLWTTDEYDIERMKLFYCAIELNREFILSSRSIRSNMWALEAYWHKDSGTDKIHFDKDEVSEFIPAIYQSLFLIIPVISTTFASLGTMFKDVKKKNVFGTLIIDEAGQAEPKDALGGILRCRKTIVVGDPKQLEPVVSEDTKIIENALVPKNIRNCVDQLTSAQSSADAINRYGTYINSSDNSEEKTWVGCPLVIHRRCISPMYDVSNELAYGGIMKQATSLPSENIQQKLLYQNSLWLNISGNEIGRKNHYVEAQGKKVVEMIQKAFEKNPKNPDVFVISPFKSVVEELKTELQSNEISESYVKGHVGTVHTFQGKEAAEVIFVLGCDSYPNSEGAIKWVNTNLVNVAVSRAKYRLYVIGDIQAWKKSAPVKKMKTILDVYALKEIEKVHNSNLSEEEKSEKIKALSNYLPTTKSFNVVETELEDGEIDYSVDSKDFVDEMKMQKVLNGPASVRIIEKFGMKDVKDLKQFCEENVRSNIEFSIKMYEALEISGIKDKQIDASAGSILLCKAFELEAKDVFVGVLKKLLPNYVDRKSKKILGEQKNEDFTLGYITTVLRKNKKKFQEYYGGKYNVEWWNQFINKLQEATTLRNTCCHSTFFSWESQETLKDYLFLGMNNENTEPVIHGLMFEMLELKRNESKLPLS